MTVVGAPRVAPVPRVPAHGVVASIAAAAGAVGLASSVLGDVVRYRAGTFIAHPADVVTAGADKAQLSRLAHVADMFGAYLLFIPIVIYLWHRLRPGNELLVDVLSVAGLVYAVVGATAAGIFAGAGPGLMRAHAVAETGEAAHIALTYALLSDLVVGMWQFVVGLVGGVWWIGVGVLTRHQWRWFARYSIFFGAVALLAVAARFAGVDYDSAAPMTLAFLPLAAWPVWLAVLLRPRGRAPAVGGPPLGGAQLVQS